MKLKEILLKRIEEEVTYEDVHGNKTIKEVIDEVFKEAESKQLFLYGVVRSFLTKEAESLGIEVNDLYLHLFDDKLYLEKEDKESFYFELEDVREVK